MPRKFVAQCNNDIHRVHASTTSKAAWDTTLTIGWFAVGFSRLAVASSVK